MSPRSRTTNLRMREETRRRIVAAALRLFAERGFRGTPMAVIAAEARISKGLAYHYFASKDALLEAVVGEWMESYLEATRKAEAAGTPAARLRALIDASLSDVHERPEQTRLVFALLLQPQGAEAARRVKTRFRLAAVRHQRLIERTLDELGWEAPAPEAAFFGAVMRGVALTALLAPPDATLLRALADRAERAFAGRRR